MSLSEKKVEDIIFPGGLRKGFYPEKDVKEFIKEDYKNTVLAKRREISWQEYARRRIKLLGKELTELEAKK